MNSFVLFRFILIYLVFFLFILIFYLLLEWSHFSSMYSKTYILFHPSISIPHSFFTSLPQLTYDDVIGCVEAKKSLKRILSFSSPLLRNQVKKFGLKCPGGAILYGPPGTLRFAFRLHLYFLFTFSFVV